MNLQLKPKQRVKEQSQQIPNENTEKRSFDDNASESRALAYDAVALYEQTNQRTNERVLWDNGKVLYTTYALNFVLHLVGIFVLTVCYAVAVVVALILLLLLCLKEFNDITALCDCCKVAAEFYITY